MVKRIICRIFGHRYRVEAWSSNICFRCGFVSKYGKDRWDNDPLISS